MSDTATAHEKAQLLLKLEFAPMYWCSSFGYNAHALKCRYHVYHLDSHPKASLLQSGLLFYASHRPDDPLPNNRPKSPPRAPPIIPITKTASQSRLIRKSPSANPK